MSDLFDIEKQCEKLSDVQRNLSDEINDLNLVIADIKDERLPKIRMLKLKFEEKKIDLETIISASRELFEKPRTQVFHDIKVGIVKQKGKIEIDDPEKTIDLIKKHLPDQFNKLVQLKSILLKTVIEQLPASDLKKIGCRIENDGDKIIVKPIATDVEKMFDALVKGEEEKK